MGLLALFDGLLARESAHVCLHDHLRIEFTTQDPSLELTLILGVDEIEE